jgi:hypothetical protein
MQNRSRAGTVLAAVVLLAVGCREDGGTAPGGENFPAMLNVVGQCLVPPSGMTGWSTGDGNTDDVALPDAPLPNDAATGPALVSSRLASALVIDDAAPEIIVSRRPQVVCLSQESGRWRLRRALTRELGAE